jgi:hypothetical protein
MEEFGCKSPISYKWDCRRDVPLSFVKNHMPFRGLKLHNELLKCANLIIVNCERRR